MSQLLTILSIFALAVPVIALVLPWVIPCWTCSLEADNEQR